MLASHLSEKVQILKSSRITAVEHQFQAALEKMSMALSHKELSHGMSLEKLATNHGGVKLYSTRLNIISRLILTRIVFEQQVCWIMLDILVNHEYERSNLWRKQVLMNLLTKDSETFGEQIRHRISQHAALYDEGFELELSELHYYQFQMIELTVPQYGAIYSRLPLLVTGVAGSGKTCTAISLLEQILLSI